MLDSTCSRCLAPLSQDDKVCPQCHALVHADELESLRTQALECEKHGDLVNARAAWARAFQLLPSDSKQAQWIENRIRDLDRATQSHSSTRTSPWAKRLGPLAPLALILAKFKTVVFALFKLKFLFSFVAFLGLYWALYGAWFGIGFAVMILVHEMGHFVEVKRRGLPADMPVFLPGLGAYVKWQALGVSDEVRALISLAGPAAGLMIAFVAATLFWRTGRPLWAALAHTGAWLNLLNLIPVWVLDGSGAVRPLDRFGRVSLLLFSGLLFWWSGEATLLFLAAGFAWQLFRKEFPSEGSIGVQMYFAALLAIGAWLLHATPLTRY